MLITLVTEFKNFLNKLNQESQIKSVFWMCNGCWNVVFWSQFLDNISCFWCACSRWWIFSPFYSKLFCCIISSIKKSVKVAIFIWVSFTARNVTAWFIRVRRRKSTLFKALITVSVWRIAWPRKITTIVIIISQNKFCHFSWSVTLLGSWSHFWFVLLYFVSW